VTERTHEAIERCAGSLTTLTDAIKALGFLNEAMSIMRAHIRT